VSWEVFEPPRSEDPALLVRRNRDLEMLSDTVVRVTSSLALYDVIEGLLDRALTHLDSERGSILTRQSDGSLRIAHARGLPPGVQAAVSIWPGEGIAGHVAATGESVWCNDIEEDGRFPPSGRAYGSRSFLSVPLPLGGAQRGVINLTDTRSRAPYSRDDLALLEEMARHATLGFRNARRYERAVERARRDALTGLVNHAQLWAMLETELKRAHRHQRPIALLLVDVDRFKDYNARHGHLEGDKALVAIARLLEAHALPHDVGARYAGTTFALLCPELDRERALAFGEKLREAIADAGFGPDARDQLTASVGVASFPGDGHTADELVRAADLRASRAKSLGRDRVCGRA
jgi:diguanylate cyclase (GGDEF)-like protein